MVARIRQLLSSGFIRSVGLLVGGTVAGQAVLFAALPFLTRLYDPSAFGLLGIYTALTVVLSVAACLRLEIATPLPREDSEAINLVVLGLISATILSLCIGLIVLGMPNQIIGWLGQQDLAPMLWMIPLGVWLAAVYSAIQFWSIRKKRYAMVAQTQLMRAVGGSGAQLGLSQVGGASFGLLFGHMIYTGLGSAGLARLFWKHDRTLLGQVNKSSLISALKRHRRFPLFSVPEAFLDSAANNLPVVFIGALVGPREAGFMLLAQRITSIPVGLLGSNLSRVYLSYSREKNDSGELGTFTRRIMTSLAKLGILPFIALGVLAPVAFPFAFGPDWGRAGVMVAWLTPAMLLQFIVAPVSTILHATENQFVAFALQLFGFVVMLGTIVTVAQFSVQWVFAAFAVSAAIYYTVYLVTVLYISFKQDP